MLPQDQIPATILLAPWQVDVPSRWSGLEHLTQAVHGIFMQTRRAHTDVALHRDENADVEVTFLETDEGSLSLKYTLPLRPLASLKNAPRNADFRTFAPSSFADTM